MSGTKRSQRGDTLIEMMFAFGILSLVVVGTMMIMNRGIRMSQESIERTLVRQQMDGQAEMVRFIHDTDPQAWANIKARLTTQVMTLSQASCPTLATLSAGPNKTFFVSKSASSFAVNAISGSNYVDASTYAKIDYTAAPKAYGMWLQIAEAQNDSPTLASMTAYDVYVHGCWYGASTSIPTTLGTIVRLYDQS